MSDASLTPPKVLWQPTPELLRECGMTQFFHWLAATGAVGQDVLTLPPQEQYRRVWEWSVQDTAAFWLAIWRYFKVSEGPVPEPVLTHAEMPGAKWFEGVNLNYAEHIFRQKTAARPAILFRNESGPLQETSWAELEQQTAALADFFKQKGVVAGDRVAAYLPNTPHAVAAVLACMSIGAVWSSCSPDFGTASVVDRFKQIQPKILIAVDGYAYGGKNFDKIDTVCDICAQLPGLEQLILIPYLNPEARANAVVPTTQWADIQQHTPIAPLDITLLPFDHPLWILYSSGTTGIPKAIVHSHGGNLLEHLKYVHLHNDVRAGERFFWYSTTGWMMWNFTVGALLGGATIVLYDGSPGFPDLNVLWSLAETTRITHFGTSAPFLVSCMRAGLSPIDQYDLSALRSIGSTGSPLPPEAFGWVYEHIKNDVWLSSMAGGTDVCTAWVGGNPLLPVYQGEIQCRCLGCAMESLDEDGRPVPVDEVGEMVVTKAMPSMPVFFWGDPSGEKYRSSYFEQYPGLWRHGDWLRITPRDGVVILGRSDATLNRQGVRIGTAEIYRALDQIPELKDSLIVNIEYADGSDWMPLFVLLNAGVVLDDALKNRIKTTLRKAYSPRHVPDEIIETPDIPYTISGKKMETPVKKVLQRKPLDKAYNPDSMRNPESMQWFIQFTAQRPL